MDTSPNSNPTLTILVRVNFPQDQDTLDELTELSLTAGATVVSTVICERRTIDAKLFIGSGKAQEILTLIQALNANLVIFDHVLSPSQERNLERLWQCQVLSRSGLILDIFAKRARTFEGKLQVELAQLQYLSTRLVRGWTHLERQKGGIGLRGPGETQLEVDKRLIKKRIKFLKERLEKVKNQRALSRKARQKSDVPTLALVGYTNAGKSTLFNALTHATVYAANQLFATLDPTLRRVVIPGFGEAILVDTVGFIRNLPHDLIKAFHATLEETLAADLLLHVIDYSHPLHVEQELAVMQVLQELEINTTPILKVYNKIDSVEQSLPRLICSDEQRAIAVYLSAREQLGFDLFYEAIASLLIRHMFHGPIILAPHQGALRSALYAKKAVLQETTLPNGDIELEINLEQAELDAFSAEYSLKSLTK